MPKKVHRHPAARPPAVRGGVPARGRDGRRQREVDDGGAAAAQRPLEDRVGGAAPLLRARQARRPERFLVRRRDVGLRGKPSRWKVGPFAREPVVVVLLVSIRVQRAVLRLKDREAVALERQQDGPRRQLLDRVEEVLLFAFCVVIPAG